MSERAIIDAFIREARRKIFEQKSKDGKIVCPIWGDDKIAYERPAGDGATKNIVYSFLTDSVYRRNPRNPAAEFSEDHAASIASAIYFQNQAGVIPDFEQLVELVPRERPNHQGRIDLFLLAIGEGDPDGAHGIETAEPNPAYGHPETEGLETDPLHFHRAVSAAAATLTDYEMQKVLDDAEKEGLVSSYIMDPPGDYLWAKLTRKGHQELKRVRRVKALVGRLSLNQALAREHVIFVLDTNILCEFKMPDQILWLELAKDACEIRLVTPAAVAEEMDGHKRTRGRLLKRALWFNDLQRRFEDNGDRPIELAEGPPRITFEIAPLRRKTDLDGDRFELDDPDGRIVAEAALYAEGEPAAIFMADDGKSIRLARNAGLLTRRPNNSWRREEPPDDRDEEIARLKEQLGAQPQLTLQGDLAYMKDSAFSFQALEDSSTPRALAKLIAARLLEKYPRAHDEYLEDLLRRYGEPGLKAGDISATSIDRYREKYSEFEAAVSEYAGNFIERYAKTAFILPVRIVAKNDGTALATDVVLEAETRGQLEFFPETQAELYFGEAPRPPDAPSPVQTLVRGYEPAFPQPARPPDPFAWSQTVYPALDGGTRRIEWRCGRFRHGDSYAPYAFVVGQKVDNAAGALSLRLRAGNIARPVEATIPIRPPSGKTGLEARHFWSAALMTDADAWVPVREAIEAYVAQEGLGAKEDEAE